MIRWIMGEEEIREELRKDSIYEMTRAWRMTIRED